MRYLVTNQTQLFESDYYKIISVEESLKILSQRNIWGLDTETKGFDPYTKALLLVQIGDFEDQIAIDTISVSIEKYKEFLEDNNNLFILHNAKFDLRFFFHHRIIITNVFDTFLAEKLLWLGYPPGVHSLSLESCLLERFKVQLDKSIRGKIIWMGLTDEVINYGLDDVKYLVPLMNEQLKDLEEAGLLQAIKIENKFVYVLAYVEYSGLKLDSKKWLAKMEIDQKNYLEAKKKLDDWVINYGNKKYIYQDLQGDLFTGFSEKKCNINWASSHQVIPLLKELGFDLLVTDKDTGELKYSVEATVIEPQKNKSELAPIYLEYKGYEKVVTTYGQNFLDQINPVSGRLHTQFNQLMDTTRLSSGGKDLDTGQDNLNFQNIPSDKETRACFVSEEGKLLIDCDYTAQEDFIFTEISRESKLIQFYNDTKKRDGHSFVAKMVYHKELSEVDELDVKKIRPDLRDISKRAKFALHYGGNGLTVSRNLALSIVEGNRFEELYFLAFPGIKDYFSKVKKETWSKGYVLISKITGHKAYIYDWDELIRVEKRFKEDNFWDHYRKYKPAYNTKLWKGQSKNSKRGLLKQIVTEFSKGGNILNMSYKKYVYIQNKDKKNEKIYTIEFGVADIYVEIVKHYFKRKGATERMSLNYPKSMGHYIVICNENFVNCWKPKYYIW